MAVFFIFLVGVLNLGLGFGMAVVIKRRYDARIATDLTEQVATDFDAEDQWAPGIDEAAEEAAETVQELLNQVGLQPATISEADEKTESENAVDAADSTPVADDA